MEDPALSLPADDSEPITQNQTNVDGAGNQVIDKISDGNVFANVTGNVTIPTINNYYYREELQTAINDPEIFSPDTNSDSPTQSVKPIPTKVVYEFVLTGSIDEISTKKLEAIVAHLRKITGDASLTLLKIEPGSIKLILEGSEEGFRALKSLVETGELEQILDVHIQKVEVQKANLSSNNVYTGQSNQNIRDMLSSHINPEFIANRELQQRTATTLVRDIDREDYPANLQSYWDKVIPLFTDVSSSHSLYAFISKRLRASNLHGIDSYDIFLEAIIRGIEYVIDHGQQIENPKAWLRVTCSQIILESIRGAKGTFKWSNEIANRINLSSNDKEIESLNKDPARAWQAFRSLSKPERQIITYVVFQNKSFSEISGLKHLSPLAVHRQYYHAIRKLREIFKQLDSNPPP
jgi:RNA polymerase sigma factor (sigma-70 family)